MKLAPSFAALSLLGALAIPCAFAADAAASSPGATPAASACRDDVARLCPGTQPGDGRIKACMKENRKKLSDACKAELKEHRHAKGK